MIKIITAIIVLFIIYSFYKWYSNRNWKLFYTVFGYEKYYQIVSILKGHGIKCKTHTPIGTIKKREIISNDFTQYDIYIKKEDEHKAIQALEEIKH